VNRYFTVGLAKRSRVEQGGNLDHRFRSDTMTLAVAATKVVFVLLLAQGVTTKAAEIQVASGSGLIDVMKDLGPQFERMTGHKLSVKYALVAVMKRQLDAGEPFDVALLVRPMIDDLVKNGKIAANTRADIARSGMGVAVRSGASKPDLASTDAFKRAVLDARSVTYTKEGFSGTFMPMLFERLGIAEEVKRKTALHESSTRTGQAVANGEVELGFMSISSLLQVRGVELAGPFPPELQAYVEYAGGIGVAAKEPEPAKALIKFLSSEVAVPVLKARGLEPGVAR
jgi:molybdate transport system substrate-binding protein